MSDKLPLARLIPAQVAIRQKVTDAILDMVVRVPPSQEKSLADSPAKAKARAQAIARTAARQASVVASSMALPPGVLGWLTVLPELIAVWKLQTQMVADIASIYGKTASMGREQMLYCLFKHVSAQVSRDVLVRVGQRFLIQRASTAVMQSLVKKLGVKVTQSVIGKSLSRFLPIIGAVGVGAYAYFDTNQVGQNAIELFSHDNVIDDLTGDTTDDAATFEG